MADEFIIERRCDYDTQLSTVDGSREVVAAAANLNAIGPRFRSAVRNRTIAKGQCSCIIVALR